MHRLLCAANACVLMLCPAIAIAAECAPPDFKNANFRNMHDVTKFAFLSTLNESDYKTTSQSFNSGMTIPYIDVPATGDFAQMKTQLQQAQRLTRTQLDQDYTETLLDITWSELGLQAYKDCLNAQKGEAVIIEPLQGVDPFRNKLAVSVTWQRRANLDPRPVKDLICLGCAASNLKKGDLMQVGEAQTIVLSREPSEPLSLVVNVDGLIGQFHLPQPPKSINKSFKTGTVTISATTKIGNNLLPSQDVICWPNEKVKLSSGEEFLIGTAKGDRIGRSGPCGDANETALPIENASQVCWKFRVFSCDLNNGFDGTYNLSVQTATPSD